MKTSSVKAKGRRLQQWARDRLLKVCPSFRAEDVKSTPMGVNGPDVQLSPYAQDILGIQVECKNREDKRIPIWEYWDQAKGHGKAEPVIFVKKNHRKPLVIIDADYYIELLKVRGDECRK